MYLFPWSYDRNLLVTLVCVKHFLGQNIKIFELSLILAKPVH